MAKFDYQKALQLGGDDGSIHAFLLAHPGLEVTNEPPKTETPHDGKHFDYEKALAMGGTPDTIQSFLDTHPNLTPFFSGMHQDTILDTPGQITETPGMYQPSIERFSNGMTRGLGVSAPVGAKVAVPRGNWKVLDAFGGAVQPGQIGDGTNNGYGNSAVLQNTDTGETLRFSHLLHTYVQPGQQIDGNTVIGRTGVTGNTSGPHLNIEYTNSQGQLGNILDSDYGKYLPITSQ